MKENPEFITFKSIQDSLGLKDPNILKIYLIEIFNDLADLKDDQNKKIFSRFVFCIYTKLPIFIAYKVFESFSKLSPEGLYEEEFVNNFVKLYMGSFEEVLSIIFNILDFDKDGKLIKDDIKLFLSYLPLKGVDEEYDLENYKEKNEGNVNDITTKIFEIQMKSLEEINNKINKAFKKIPYSMDLTQFTQLITEKNSEIFLQILCFLYDKMPFTAENVEALEMKYNQIKKENLLINSLDNDDTKNSNQIKIKIPKNSTLLSSSEKFIEKFNIKKFSIKINTRKSTDNIYCFKKSNDSDNKKTNKNIYNNEKYGNIINNDKNVTNVENEVILNNQKLENKNQIGVILKLNTEEKNKNRDSDKINIRNMNNPNKITYENWIYKMTKHGKLKEFYLVLINKDIYYYKTVRKKELDGMHNLTGCCINKLKSKILLEGKELFAFEIYFKNKSRQRIFYIDDRNIFKEFTKKIKLAIGYKKLSDYYEKREVIGEGTFGLVNLGINKKTGQQVAIKTIKKEYLVDLKDKEMIINEINILKHCHHPNIVRLLDYFEDNEHIYIILEYIQGGNLRQYLINMSYNFTEKQVANIMSQIASGIKYLHQYGIIHRDLKLSNIMITQQSDSGIIKIADFGLSKIVSPTKRINSGSGTLNYMPPEVIKKIPYNKEVDIWSMGVILHCLLCGSFPFHSKDENELAEKILNEELEFNKYYWDNRSKNGKDLIKSCLDKSGDNRINIDNFINHPLFKKNKIK